MYTLEDVDKAYTYYGKVPFIYNLFSNFFGKFLKQKAINKLDLKPGDRVLEIACGTGLNFKLIENIIGSKGEITAVDYTEQMLKHAKKLMQRKKWKNITLIKSDAANTMLKQNYFDAAISTLGFSSIPDHKKALKNTISSLKKGKKLVILDGKSFTFKPLNLLMPVLRWNKSWDRNKDLIKDTRHLFKNKEIKIEEYYIGSNFILELTN